VPVSFVHLVIKPTLTLDRVPAWLFGSGRRMVPTLVWYGTHKIVLHDLLTGLYSLEFTPFTISICVLLLLIFRHHVTLWHRVIAYMFYQAYVFLFSFFIL